jgi:hypothetical protein
MNQLAAILKRRRVTENPIAERREQARQRRSGRDAELEKADDDKKLEELEALLKTFEEDEVLPDDFAQVSLESPVLLILAQHRSFRICRRKFFCLEENCQERETIKTLNKYVTHMQKCHGASQKETMDMVSYVIRKFLRGPVEAVVRTVRGVRVRGDWRLHRCHYPGCSYVNGLRVRVEEHIRRKHSEMAKDIKALGWFWGTIHAMIKKNPWTTIAEVLEQTFFFEPKWTGVGYHSRHRRHWLATSHRDMWHTPRKDGKRRQDI